VSLRSRFLEQLGISLVVIACLAARSWYISSTHASTLGVGAMPSSPAIPAHVPIDGRSQIGFRDPSRLFEHHEKDGAEFGVRSAEEYLHLAQQLRDRPVGGAVLEAVRRDGTVTRYDRASGVSLAFDADGTIRTFFRRNDGEAYIRRQLNREPGQP
jgi:hypothetical protein